MALPEISDLARITGPVELKNTPSGKPVAKVRLAFNENRYNQDTKSWDTTATLWVDGEVWEQQAERLAEQANQGDEIHVVGQLKTDQWEKDGEKKSKTVLRIRRFKVFPKGGGQPAGGSTFQQPAAAPQGAQWGGNQQSPAQWGNQPQNGQQWGQPAPF